MARRKPMSRESKGQRLAKGTGSTVSQARSKATKASAHNHRTPRKSRPEKAVATAGIQFKVLRPGAKTRRGRGRLGIRERIGQLTYHGACKLMHEQDGAARLRQGYRFEINVPRDVRFIGDMFQVQVVDSRLNKNAEVTMVEVPTKARGLQVNCNLCSTRCDHVAAVLSLVLDEKLSLGLAAPPDPDEPLENLTESELLQRALAERQNRALNEPMSLKAISPQSPWSDYSITSGLSGKTWRVSLRGLETGQSYCSCPDFRSNRLGTCKHILYALEIVRQRFSAKILAKKYQRKSFSLRLDYSQHPALQFNVPDDLNTQCKKIVGSLGVEPTQDVAEVAKRVAALERAGYPVHIYPDAEEFIDQRLQQSRLSTLVQEIRQNPAAHALRKNLLKVELLPYQLDGIAFAVGAGRSILADDMGLGKTIQGIGVAELLAQQAEISRVLVVCPASVKSQWLSEIHKFSHRPGQVVLGSAEERIEQYYQPTFFTICNYEQVMRDHATIEQIPWDLIILDEGQRIKNWESQTARVIKSLRSRFALVLSGTPLENRLEELYAVASFIDPVHLGPVYRFFHQHRIVDDRGKVIGYQKLDQLREKLKPVLLRRTRREVMQELPERTTEIVRIEPTEEQMMMSEEFTKRAAQVAAKKFLTEMDLLKIQKFLLCARMACDSTFLVDRERPGYSSKLERLAELLEQLAADPARKIILFSEWTRMLDLIEPILKKLRIEFVRLDGSIPQKQRQQIIWKFQNDPNTRAIIMSNAGTTGLNLQAANTVINIDLPWNPAVLEQRIGRAHRMGQKNPVDVYLLVTTKTIEERMLDRLAAKYDLAMAALDSESKVTKVELTSGIEELKRRLEVLVGESPIRPIDESMRREAEDLVANGVSRLTERRTKVASAGGELLGAAINLVSELIAPQQPPDQQTVSQIEKGLAECAEVQADGRLSLRFDLADRTALNRLAATLATLLVTDKQ